MTAHEVDGKALHGLSELELWDVANDSVNLVLKIIDGVKDLTLDGVFDSLEQPKIGRRKIWAVRWVEKLGSVGVVQVPAHHPGSMHGRIVMVQ